MPGNGQRQDPKREMLAFLRSRMGAETASRWVASLYVWHGARVRENGSGKFGQAPDLVGPCVLRRKLRWQ